MPDIRLPPRPVPEDRYAPSPVLRAAERALAAWLRTARKRPAPARPALVPAG